MAILRYDPDASPPVDDLATYAPNIKDPANVANLQGFIKRAQVIAESPLGAGRVLEKRQIIGEVIFDIPVSRPTFRGAKYWPVQSFYLAAWPVASIDKLEARLSVGVDSWGEQLPTTDWTTLTADEYDLEPNTGFVILKSTQFFTEARVNYTGGFDFSITETPELEAHKDRIRTAVGLILEFLLGARGGGAIRELGPNRVVFDAAPAGDIPVEARDILMQYRPSF